MSGNNGGSGDAEFDAFAASGEVEGDFSSAGGQSEPEAKEPAKPAAKRGPPREAPTTAKAPTAPAGDDDDDAGEGGEGGEEGDDEEGAEPKPKKTPAEHQIERLKREKRDLQRQLRAGGNTAVEQRLASLETRLTGGNPADTKNAGTTAPDPLDAEKYPLGHLDDRYIEDKLEWLAEQKASKTADSILQRQQETERQTALREAQTELLGKVDTLATKGTELFEDFQESVVEAGMRGEWDLSQTTFEAAHDAENGAQILYNLSQDPDEASRVAKLSPFQQLKYVADKDAELGGKKPRTKPQAGDPPKNTARGANSRTQINPATDDLGDFERQWEREAKGKK